MKLFSWIRSKRNGSHNPQPNLIYDVMHESCKEEFSDWPNGLLAIGTFGNNTINLKHSDDSEQVETELRVDVSLDSTTTPSSEKEKENLSVEQLLDCLRRGGGGGGALLESQISVIQRGGRNDIQSDKKNRGIGKSSLSFLIKKALLCGGGFATSTPPSPPPIIRDPLSNSKLDRSTMEKILRAMLQKKIHPQRPNTPTKYLDMAESESEDERESEEESHQSKWVKTDSEYIVLEI